MSIWRPILDVILLALCFDVLVKAYRASDKREGEQQRALWRQVDELLRTGDIRGAAFLMNQEREERAGGKAAHYA